MALLYYNKIWKVSIKFWYGLIRLLKLSIAIEITYGKWYADNLIKFKYRRILKINFKWC